MCTSSVSNVIYHKFSHGAAFYTLNGKNINVMLELLISQSKFGALQGALESWDEFSFIFRELGSTSNYFKGAGEF